MTEDASKAGLFCVHLVRDAVVPGGGEDLEYNDLDVSILTGFRAAKSDPACLNFGAVFVGDDR